MNQIAKEWQDYEVIDTGNKEKLERPMLFIIVLNRVVVIGK